MARRRDDRIETALPVRVWGMGVDGRPFSENIKTIDVSRTGARLAWPDCPAKVGDIVGLQYQGEKTRFRIVWLQAGKREVGVTGVEVGKSIWGQLEPAAQATQPIAAHSAVAAAAPAKAGPAPRERRSHRRFRCDGGVRMRKQDGTSLWGTLADVSAGGCYIETTATLAVGTELELVLKIHDAEIQCRAQVRASHPGIGVGVSFTMVSVEARRQLNRLIEISAGVMPPAASLQPAPEPKTTAPLSGSEELKSFDTLLHSDTTGVDPRILTEFKNAVEHARQSAWAVQTWVEMKKQQRDPFTLMPLIEKRRVRLTNLLLRDLLMDYQSNALGEDTEGFQDLVSAIKKFHIALGL